MKKNKYRIHNIKLTIDETLEVIPRKVEKKLGLTEGTIEEDAYQVIKESIDARDEKTIYKVYTVDFEVPFGIRTKKNVGPAPDKNRGAVRHGDQPLTKEPVVVGFGPCGLFTALELARHGFSPIVIERGAAMEDRTKDVAAFWNEGQLNKESNVLFGEGGAGTFSDGKLTSGIKDVRVRYVLETFVDAGAPSDILYKQKPHIGTDVLRDVVVHLRKDIERFGGQILFNTALTDIEIEDGQVKAVEITQNGEKKKIETNTVFLAIGHSAGDTFHQLFELGLTMVQKPFSIGVRIEHPQAMIDQAQYGDEKRLPPADYKLSCKTKSGRGVYTFCMCPGGYVITTATQEGELSVNGMSNRARDSKLANSGVLCDVHTEDFGSDDVLAGFDFQRKYEKLAFENGKGGFNPPRCTWADFRDQTEDGKAVIESLPAFAVEAIQEALPIFGRKLKGFDSEEAILTAVETRSSAPVRILRDTTMQSNIKGIYPVGEGSGYAGGITSAACDGIKAAEKVITMFNAQWME